MPKKKPARNKTAVAKSRVAHKSRGKAGPEKIEEAIRGMERVYRFNTWAGGG